MEKKNSGLLVGLILGLVIAVVIVVGLFATGTIGFKNVTASNEQRTDISDTRQEQVLSEQEALKIGKELYDNATKVYEYWRLLPYCGEYTENDRTVTFKSGSKMFESKFKDLEELRNYLLTFLSDEIVNSHIKEKAITDLSILDTSGNEYTNYAIKDGKLYCRLNSGKGWLSRYLNDYEIKINTIKNDIVIFDVKLANVNAYVAEQTGSKCTYGSKISDCSENQIEYVDTKFIIKKIDEKWIVTDYVLHD